MSAGRIVAVVAALIAVAVSFGLRSSGDDGVSTAQSATSSRQSSTGGSWTGGTPDSGRGLGPSDDTDDGTTAGSVRYLVEPVFRAPDSSIPRWFSMIAVFYSPAGIPDHVLARTVPNWVEGGPGGVTNIGNWNRSGHNRAAHRP